MIGIRFVRENPDVVRESQRRRGNDEALVNALLAADEARRLALQAFGTTRASQKELSRPTEKASPEERPAALAEAKALVERVKELEAAANGAKQKYLQANAVIQNTVLEGVPAGGEGDYEVLKRVDEPRVFDFEPKDHLDVVKALDAIDMVCGTKVSGSRFYYLKGMGARFELTLLTMAVDQAEAAGFTTMTTSTLVDSDIIAGTGFLGAHSDEIYYLPVDDQYLVGTSGVTLAGYHKGETVDLSNGPLRYAGWSSCYRREAGSYDKDMCGIIRVHQFNRVEMFSYCRLEKTEEEHRCFLAWEEEMLAKVELPYRVINTATGDLGSSVAQKLDCEAWLPTQNRFMEVTSASNYTTSQAWRLGIRGQFDGETRTAATLNGTPATTCWLVALFENHQRPDGSLYIPEVLRPHLGRRESFELVTRQALRFRRRLCPRGPFPRF